VASGNTLGAAVARHLHRVGQVGIGLEGTGKDASKACFEVQQILHHATVLLFVDHELRTAILHE